MRLCSVEYLMLYKDIYKLENLKNTVFFITIKILTWIQSDARIIRIVRRSLGYNL